MPALASGDPLGSLLTSRFGERICFFAGSRPASSNASTNQYHPPLASTATAAPAGNVCRNFRQLFLCQSSTAFSFTRNARVLPRSHTFTNLGNIFCIRHLHACLGADAIPAAAPALQHPDFPPRRGKA